MRALSIVVLGVVAGCGVRDGMALGESSGVGMLSEGLDGGTASAGNAEAGAETGGDADDGQARPRFDVADTDLPGAGDGGMTGCGLVTGEGDLDFSYIWVANSQEGTVSKIDTESLVEVGRYQTRPDRQGDPSRTSVSLSGDVAVANRAGGITKIYARAEDCAGPNTSAGPTDVRPWGADDCVAWHAPFPNKIMRPVAWAAGDVDPVTCTVNNETLWTTSSSMVQAEENSVVVHRLDGDTGDVLVDVAVPELVRGPWGPYGGAVDGDNNFWFVHREAAASGSEQIVRVDGTDHSYEIIDMPPEHGGYGIAVDLKGRIWVSGSGVARYDPATRIWARDTSASGDGLMADAKGRMWVAGGRLADPGDTVIPSVHAFDVDTMQLLDSIPAGAELAKGVSIDFRGRVWVVDQLGQAAIRIDPDTRTFEKVTGLHRPYTYSDMTGWGLRSVALPIPPQG